LLKDNRITSVLVGASSANQLLDSLKCLDNLSFSSDELNTIESILKSK
jgi:L-glyceraldehyde 3-phosphate reductase